MSHICYTIKSPIQTEKVLSKTTKYPLDFEPLKDVCLFGIRNLKCCQFWHTRRKRLLKTYFYDIKAIKFIKCNASSLKKVKKHEPNNVTFKKKFIFLSAARIISDQDGAILKINFLQIECAIKSIHISLVERLIRNRMSKQNCRTYLKIISPAAFLGCLFVCFST